MEDQERSPEELPPEPREGRGLVFPPWNLAKTFSGPEEALDAFNAAVDALAEDHPEVVKRYTTVQAYQLRVVRYNPQRFDGGHYPNRHEDRKGWKKTPRHETYRESQQGQQDPDRRSY